MVKRSSKLLCLFHIIPTLWWLQALKFPGKSPQNIHFSPWESFSSLVFSLACLHFVKEVYLIKQQKQYTVQESWHDPTGVL